MNADFLSKWLVSGAVLGFSQNRILLAVGEKERSDRPANFYAPDFFLNASRPWIHYETETWIHADELEADLARLDREKLPPLVWAPLSQTFFQESFQSLQHDIRSGQLSKGVPYTIEQTEARMNGQRLIQSLIALLKYSKDRSVFPYGFWNPTEGMLGCTPELLFSQDRHGDISTMALAGTRRAEDRHLPPLLEDPKERREHQWVIDAIVNDLGPLGRIDVHPTEVAELPRLSHLKTRIELHPTGEARFADLIRALHPTPALGAFPRDLGWKWLLEMEKRAPLSRGRFGAPFGAIWRNADGSQEGLCAVAIRGIQWQGPRIALSAGCGVIAESEIDREWQELQGKIRAIKDILGL